MFNKGWAAFTVDAQVLVAEERFTILRNRIVKQNMRNRALLLWEQVHFDTTES